MWAPNRDAGTYNQVLMDGILALQTTMASLGYAGRLRVGPHPGAACILAVRIAVRRHTHGHTNTNLNIPRISASSKRLLRRLEAARKHLKRTEIGRSGLISYRETSRDWHRFVLWLRVHFLDCRCTEKRGIPHVGRTGTFAGLEVIGNIGRGERI